VPEGLLEQGLRAHSGVCAEALLLRRRETCSSSVGELDSTEWRGSVQTACRVLMWGHSVVVIASLVASAITATVVVSAAVAATVAATVAVAATVTTTVAVATAVPVAVIRKVAAAAALPRAALAVRP